jgi:hypothetical protein
MATLTEVRDRGRDLFTTLLTDQQVVDRQARPGGADDRPRFSWFDTRDATDAGLLAMRITAAAATRSGETTGLAAALAVVDEERTGADPELVRQGLALFVTHNERGRRLVKPRVVEVAPGLFLPPEVHRVGLEVSIGGLSPQLDYWREDMLANEHHQHWHEVYPWIGRPPESFEHWVHEVPHDDQLSLLRAMHPERDWQSILAGATPAEVAEAFTEALDRDGRRNLTDTLFRGELPWRVFRQLFRLNDRHGELFLYMHRQMLARYDAELLSHGLDRVRAFDQTQWDGPIPEGYDPEGLGAGNLPFTIRRQNRTLPDDDVEELGGLLAEVEDALSSRRVPGPDDSLPAQPIAASSFGEFLELHLHNTGHGRLGSLSEPIPGTNRPNGVMNSPVAAIRDQVFWRWHKLIDDLGDEWEQTREPADLSDGPPVVLRDSLGGGPGAAPWASPDIILVRSSDLPDQSAAQLAQLGARLFGGASWDQDFTAAPAQSGQVSLTTRDELVTVVSTATLSDGRTIKFLNHEPFSYFLRVENTEQTPVSVTVRIFLVPAELEEDRRAWIEMDKFAATLEAGQKAVLHRPDTESAVVKRAAETSPTQIADRPDGRNSYCDCGWPYTLLLPKGTDGAGMSCRLLVMLTDATVDQLSQPGECGSMSFCGARDRYPDNREMGYPFARPFGPGTHAVRDTLLALPHVIGRTVTVRHA